ncbi:glycosyltransferase family 2 protein [Candidatus Micrarchaeota archaeon]|nr:glycosyltransferase family 2 protein [Candidatus Micrarchaeota archaeon]
MDIDFVLLINYVIAFITLFSVNFFILLYFKHKDSYLTRPDDSGIRPKVSIVIPAYNEGMYLEQCLQSVLSLDYPKEKLEIIMVDDGSTDDTCKIAKNIAASAEQSGFNFRVFTKENKGKGAALNFGIAKISGEFVATMDADSYLSPNVLLEMLPYFEDKNTMAVTPAVKIAPTRSWLKELQRVEYLMILFSRKILSFVDSVPVTPGPFSLFRSSVFSVVGGFDEKNLVEDQEIALRIQSHNFKIHSSLTAEVYTEPPAGIGELLKQRVRWQRGGVRNYWHYRKMIKPEYGDFGMYFIPMNFIALAAFFTIIGLLLYSFFIAPYYVRYIWVQTLGMNIDLFTFLVIFVVLSTTIFVSVAVKSFKGEKVNPIYILSFVAFYWYLMFGYNILMLIKELRQEAFSW